MSEYLIAARDSAPIVIGGIGGSGTRLVTDILRRQGVRFGGELNEALDNLWFSLLFVRKTILLKTFEEHRRMAWLLTNAMRGGLRVPSELKHLLDEAAAFDRGPALTKSVLEHARETMLSNRAVVAHDSPWGWKQPNTHVMVPLLNLHFPQMKYIYVMRNGLDMAFSGNQNQLKYFWGDLMLDGDITPSPRNALRYWVACFKRISADYQALGDRLCILNFDALCREPAVQITMLNQFLGLDVADEQMQAVADSISPPNSIGRHRRHDCSELNRADVEFVRNLGFDVAL